MNARWDMSLSPGTLRIGEVAARAGVGVETLRFYERRGLLAPPPRLPSGYRVYPAAVVGQVRLIRWAQGLGFTLREVRELVGVAADHAHHRTQRVRRSLPAKLQQIDARIARLRDVRRQLEALARCRCDGSCPILARATAPDGPGPVRRVSRTRRSK